MKNDLSANEILKITTPEQLFTKDNFKMESTQLLFKWHPDKCNSPQSNEVTAKLNHLIALAKEKLLTDTWKEPGIFLIKTITGSSFKVKYTQEKILPIGKMYYGKTVIAYDIPDSNQDLNKNLSGAFVNLSRISDNMKKEFDRFIPHTRQIIKTQDSTVYIFDKTEDVIPLSDLMLLVERKLDPKHVAWVGNRLFNLACFLRHNGLVYNTFTLDNIFVSPKYHSALLIGGWWYSTEINHKLSAIPGELLTILPKQIKVDKISKSEYDILSIKYVLLKLLGDKTGTGMSLLCDKTIPKPMLDYLRLPALKDSVQDYKAWGKVIDECFGERKFIELNVNIHELYETK